MFGEVKKRFLKEITIDEDGIVWTFADNEDLTNNDEWDEDHHYKMLHDDDVYIYVDELEANDQALSLNVLKN